MLIWLKEVEYLRYLISNKGVVADPAKIACMVDWPKPASPRALHELLGLTGYYRQFVQDYGKIS